MNGYCYSVDAKAARISEEYAKKAGITTDEAMRKFLCSATYRALNDSETGLYLEVFEFVYDMFLEELGELQDE